MKSKTESVTLKDMSTRELLQSLNTYGNVRYERVYPFDMDSDNIQKQYVGRRLVAGGKTVEVYATFEDIRKELATRPHIPSKREGAALRRAKAKAGR